MPGQLDTVPPSLLGPRYAREVMHAEIRAQLDRVGVTYGKAGPADYVQDRDEGEGWVAFLGPPRPPRLTWRGMAGEALRRLKRIQDDAGVRSFWAAFQPGQLVCAQCCLEAPPDAKGWQMHLGYDVGKDERPEAFVFCPACAEREFGGN